MSSQAPNATAPTIADASPDRSNRLSCRPKIAELAPRSHLRRRRHRRPPPPPKPPLPPAPPVRAMDPSDDIIEPDTRDAPAENMPPLLPPAKPPDPARRPGRTRDRRTKSGTSRFCRPELTGADCSGRAASRCRRSSRGRRPRPSPRPRGYPGKCLCCDHLIHGCRLSHRVLQRSLVRGQHRLEHGPELCPAGHEPGRDGSDDGSHDEGPGHPGSLRWRPDPRTRR